jgi:hypothetical protein
MTPRTTALAVAASAVATVTLAACSGSTPSAGAGTPSGATTTTTSPSVGGQGASTSAADTRSQPAPVATESNPPGDIPDTQTYVVFAPAGQGFAVKVPEGWAQARRGNTTTFSDKLNRIQMSTSKAASTPTTASVRSADVPALQATVAKFAVSGVKQVNMPAGPATLLTYQGDSAVDPVTGKVVRDAFERYIFYRAGHRVDLTLAGPTNADNVDPWRIVSDSLRWR